MDHLTKFSSLWEKSMVWRSWFIDQLGVRTPNGRKFHCPSEFWRQRSPNVSFRPTASTEAKHFRGKIRNPQANRPRSKWHAKPLGCKLIYSASIELHHAQRLAKEKDAFKEDDRIVTGRAKAMSTALEIARAGGGVIVVAHVFFGPRQPGIFLSAR